MKLERWAFGKDWKGLPIPHKRLWTWFCKRLGWKIRILEEGNSGGSVPVHSGCVNECTQHVIHSNVPYSANKRLYYNENPKSHCHVHLQPYQHSILQTIDLHDAWVRFDLSEYLLLHFLCLSHTECNQHQCELVMSLIQRAIFLIRQ